MARKKASLPITVIPLELAVNQQEAEIKITDRINKSNELLEITIQNSQQLHDAGKEYAKWDDFNKQLLKRLFTSEELFLEYNRYKGGMSILRGEKSLGEKRNDFTVKVEDKCHRLESIIERLELIPESRELISVNSIQNDKSKNVNYSQIFIVHGHDDSAKLEVARFIEKLGFEPIIIHEQPNASKTIIEKIEAFSNVGFGVVIYSPCDIGGKNKDNPELAGRARQNVVFEHGFLIGKLGRSKVCPLVTGNVETPNDISGIVYTSMDTSNWQIALAKELRTADYAVDMNDVI
ncbi:putative nucleotide-binding protein containing TIR-like domain [Psychromonas ingrahamii 37]|uniref:Putative nucleotide-binding protein containing TIR-like domain n=1 Tax=Psychromonas ingrahamii (strain DSM 17664 / CCUG 51855 / 37) TaxID=357804 RepID=A1SX31_PSYIN|nr:nucleotide-binding protein [Psychromonas ingrahamii]ABM04046.1 putative nucleotide-binding protein containing TIR-like domain [Psychromonas ingrahamii 37]